MTATTPATLIRRTDRPTTDDLIARFVVRNPRQPYTGTPTDPPRSWLANTITKLRSRRLEPTATANTADSAGECRPPAECENAEEAAPLIGRRIFFLNNGRLEYGTVVDVLDDGPSGIPEFFVSTNDGTVIKYGDEFKLSQLPEERLAS